MDHNYLYLHSFLLSLVLLVIVSNNANSAPASGKGSSGFSVTMPTSNQASGSTSMMTGSFADSAISGSASQASLDAVFGSIEESIAVQIVDIFKEHGEEILANNPDLDTGFLMNFGVEATDISKVKERLVKMDLLIHNINGSTDSSTNELIIDGDDDGRADQAIILSGVTLFEAGDII